MASADNKRILKNTLALYIRMFLVMGVSLYTSRVVLNQLGIADYGVYNVVGGVVVMLSFFNGSMATATQRFLAYSIGKQDKELELRTFSMSFFIHLMIAAVIYVLAETVGYWFVKTYLVFPPESRSAALWVYHLSVITSVIGIVTVPFTSILIAHEKMSAYAYVSILEVTLKLAVALLLMFIHAEKLKLYAVLLLCAGIIISFTWIVYARRTIKECRVNKVWDKGLFHDMFGFVGWQTIGQVSLMLRTQGVNVLINMFFGPVVNAARAVAVQVNTAVLNFSQNFQTASVPQINKLYAADRLQDLHRLMVRTSKLTFLLMLIVSMPILVETEPILKAWLKIIPDDGVLFVQLMLATALVNLLSGVLVFGALATGRVKEYQTHMICIYGLDIVVVYIFFKLGFPAYSFFFVEMVIHLIGLGVRLYLLKKFVNLSPRMYLTEVVGRILTAAAAACAVVFTIKYFMPTGLLFIVLDMAIAAAVTALSAYLFALNAHERQWALSGVRKAVCKIIKH